MNEFWQNCITNSEQDVVELKKQLKLAKKQLEFFRYCLAQESETTDKGGGPNVQLGNDDKLV
jgi:hypothetical protein